jgi:hypothetical protein
MILLHAVAVAERENTNRYRSKPVIPNTRNNLPAITAPLPVNDHAPMKNCDSVLRERAIASQKKSRHNWDTGNGADWKL